ncbi:hypothetical protein TBR22_A35430 [Luteitalea sp. TBR-22]|uniref:serine/threonine-protein kinase n=1 Tax=Luteitalea sp. TBR-22 TaxID=2802971 RepID=UPI001AF66A8B|nr:serine/threonine-protein kinase [Luteitalea sp. TBR-22]BCS34313.1 hypothetical protein TBR22_A35430 [Luteitalea sp. TBR-22]
MTPEQWARVTALFGEARDLPADERAAFLDRACGDDTLVRREVLGLLEADRDDGFLEGGAAVQPVDLLDEAGGRELAPGETLGPYVVERLLARGGMGVLYVALDPRLGRKVTLKVLPAATARDPQARARLQREARTAAQLRHPHIVSVHALEEIGSTPVIVAEYVEGQTLAEVLASEGPLPRERWHDVARALAEALGAAHAAQVVHRDVKPANVVLGRDGVRLIDFGIALATTAEGDTRLTHVGHFTGTMLAQAPEVLDGGQPSALSDQFQFGLVLYEAASGRHAFGEGPVAGVWARMLRDEPTPLSVVARDLWPDDIAIVHRCLSRQPGDRFGSMGEVAQALAAARASATSQAIAPVASVPDAVRTAAAPPWHDVHHAVTAALYIGLLWPGSSVAGALPPRWRTPGYMALVTLASTATSLRLHLWFSVKHYPRPVAQARQRLWPLLTTLDVVYASVLAGLALHAGETRLVAALVTAGLAVCLLMASLVIEPATRRASEI